MKNNKRTFGIEIELVHGNKYAMRDALQRAGIDCEVEGYNHTTRPHWKIVTDSSIRGGGYEVVSPILKGEEGLDEVRRVCEVLNEQGATVNRSCGLHVHHGAEDLKARHLQNLLNLYRRSEGVIDSMMPVSRRENNNTYCRSLQHLNEGEHPGGRYYKLNLESLHVHGTVEFRQHSGTTEAEKIINWVNITQMMVERSKRKVGNSANLHKYDFMQAIGLIHNTTEYEDRIREYMNMRVEVLSV